MLLTSFSALPASCRCRLFIWEVFFFGTARSTPSHMSERRPGMFSDIAGIDKIGEEYIALGECRRVEPEIRKDALLVKTSRESTENAAKAGRVAIMSATMSMKGCQFPVTCSRHGRVGKV